MFKKDELKKFQKEALESHNEYRSMHGTPKLKLADDLNKIAQAYAEELAKTDSFRHSKCDGIGENLAMHFSSKSTDYCGGEATKQWYSEIQKCNFDRPGFTPGTGHFTQVVWAETKEMGIGKAVTKSGKVIAVANYRPAGNMLSKFKDNVLPLKKGASANTTKHRHRSSSSSSSSSSDDEDKKSKGKLGLFKKKDKDSDSTDISKSELRKFQKEMLTAHNKHREKHGVPALKLSDEVCKDAQKFAEKLAKTGKLEHSHNHEYGENVGMHYSSATTEYSGTEATNQWYSEVSKYDFSDPRFKSGIGHFTQVVWKDSKELGVGKAITKDGKVIFVANYRPPGNMSGDFDKNVFPEGYKPSKDSKKKDEEKDKKISKSEQKQFQQDALTTHNEYRVKHGVPKLTASEELNKHSQKWAEHLAKTGKFEHSEQRQYGENIAMHYSSETTDYSGKECSDHWYSELRNYDFKNPAFSQGTGHFSQMVWKNSKQFGIGKAITKDKRVVVVATYEPPGNYIGQFPDNVINRTDGYLPPKPDGAHKVKIVKASDDCKTQAKNFKMVPDDLKSFQKDALEAHNKYRSKHKAPALKESKELTKMAQEWAEHLVKNELFEHRESSDTGENIAMHFSSASINFTGKEATDMWYSEVSKHDFSSPGFQSGSGHFTQVVWKSSKEFGIGKAITKEGKVIVVGNYRPPGNIMQRFAENVSSGN